MFKHVVSFKLKEDNKELMQEAKKMILSLGALPEVINIEVGENEIESARSYDFVIVAEFRSREDFDIYDKHEMHNPVREFVSGIVSASAAVDYSC